MGGTAFDLVSRELGDLYDAKHRLHDVLVEMASDAADGELGLAFREHAVTTQDHVRRLRDVFELVGHAAARESCDGMAGLVDEYHALVRDETVSADARDFGAAVTALKAVHSTMASSTALIIGTRALGRPDAGVWLEQMLDEEAAIARRLESLTGLIAQRAGRDVRKLPSVQPSTLLPDAAAVGATQPGVVPIAGHRKKSGGRKRSSRRD